MGLLVIGKVGKMYNASWEDGFNAGYNKALDELRDIVQPEIDHWQEGYLERLTNPQLAEDYKKSITVLEWFKEKIEGLRPL